MLPLDEGILRSRFWSLMRMQEQIRAESKPLRDEYEALNRQIDALLVQQKVFSKQFIAVEEPLFGIAQELAMLARALKGVTGQPPLED